eukprot:scaffold8538_cov54-Attheya_sp.AAC.3
MAYFCRPVLLFSTIPSHLYGAVRVSLKLVKVPRMTMILSCSSFKIMDTLVNMSGNKRISLHVEYAAYHTVMGFDEQQSGAHDNRHRLLLLITGWQLE